MTRETRRKKKYNSERVALTNKWLSAEYQAAYTPNYIVETLTSELEKSLCEERQVNSLLNDKLKAAVTDLRDKVKARYYAPFVKPDDYSAQITNALEMLKMLGHNISEADVEMILAPFKYDYEQMQVFHRLIDNIEMQACKIEQRAPRDFDNTFAQVNACAKALAEYDEAHAIAENLFIGKQYEDNSRVFNGAYIAASYHDGYDEITGQARLIELEEGLTA